MSPDTDDSRRPLVLVITASVGSGHNQAAKAILETLPSVAPDARTEQADAMDLAPKFFRAYYARGFAFCMTHLPRTFGLGFRLENLPQTPRRTLREKARLAWERFNLARLGELVSRSQPDLIVHTHFLAAATTTHLVRKGLLKARQVCVVTDVIPHRWWYNEGIEHYFVAAQASTEPLLRWGIGQERFTVSGIPIRPKWQAPLDRPSIYREWDLPVDRKIVLLSCGAEFTVGPVVKMARGIVEACPQACVVVLAGRNKELLADLAATGYPPARLRPMGYTDRMPELAEVATLMVAKAGGITTAECLSKGLPMVFFRPVPGQEGCNAEFFQEQGAGLIARDAGELVNVVRGLLESPARLEELSQNAGRLYRPGADIICRTVAAMLR